MILIICLVIELIILGVLCKFICEDYQHARQRNQYHRKYGHEPCEPNDAAGMNLGILGKPNLKSGSCKLISVIPRVAISEETTNLIGRGTQKPVLRLKLIAALRNFLWCLSHKDRTITQPNLES